MDLPALQQRLRAFAAERAWQPYHTPKNLAMALMVEAAELLELFQWQTLPESRGFTRDPRNKERVADEIADVLLYLLQLADHVEVDVEQAVENKLRKNAEKYPPKYPAPPAAPSISTPAPKPPRTHLLVDWENVQPAGVALKALVPEGTHVWLFHGPHQKVDASGHRRAYGDTVTLVPRSGQGRNALDFQLTYYVGYITARQPDATFVVVSNDRGYDPMLEHVCGLGFNVRRCSFPKSSESPAPPAPPPRGSVPEALTQEALAVPTASAMTGVKATRRDMQSLISSLEGLTASQRPSRKDALLAFLQSHLGERHTQSPRVLHALAQLQALKRVMIKKELVSYPQSLHLTTSASSKVKGAAIRTTPTAALREPTPAHVAHTVLVSLKKMPKNRPRRRAGLLKLIETHASKVADRQGMALKVWSLLEARKDVVLALKGEGLRYPKLEAQKSSGAA